MPVDALNILQVELCLVWVFFNLKFLIVPLHKFSEWNIIGIPCNIKLLCESVDRVRVYILISDFIHDLGEIKREYFISVPNIHLIKYFPQRTARIFTIVLYLSEDLGQIHPHVHIKLRSVNFHPLHKFMVVFLQICIFNKTCILRIIFVK